MKRKILITAVSLLGLAAVGAAVFLAFRLFHQPVEASGGSMTTFSPDGQSSQTYTEMRLEGSDLLPKGHANLVATVKSRDGNSLVAAQVINNGDGTVSKGPTTEVILTEDTQIYQDITLIGEQGKDTNGKTYQQQVELVSGDDIGVGDLLVVWGDKRGDRLVADTICYTDLQGGS